MATLTGLPAGVPVNCLFGPAIVATAARLRPRRPHEDRNRSGAHRRRASGIRRPSGSPIAILIENKDWKNWSGISAGGGERRRTGQRQAGGAAAARARGPGRAPSNTTFPMRVTSWSGPARGKQRRAWRSGALAKTFLQRVRHRGVEPRGGGRAGAPGAPAAGTRL